MFGSATRRVLKTDTFLMGDAQLKVEMCCVDVPNLPRCSYGVEMARPDEWLSKTANMG